MIVRKTLKKISLILSFIIVLLIISIFPKKENLTSNKVIAKSDSFIYLLDNNDFIAAINIKYLSNNQDDIIKEINNYLTINKNINIKKGFQAIIPKNTKLLNYELNDGTLVLNYSKEILNISKELEVKMIESIIYSYTEQNFIKNIIIKVNNEELNYLPKNKVYLNYPLNRTFKINKKYDLKNKDNIEITTIYYYALNNDFSYYIPVTRYENTKKEKIEIIISELTSSTTYNSNLINILKEIKLTSYEINDNTIILYFDENFLSLENANITEEVTYTINSSIKENYNLNYVIYYVNDKYYKSYCLDLG